MNSSSAALGGDNGSDAEVSCVREDEVVDESNRFKIISSDH